MSILRSSLFLFLFTLASSAISQDEISSELQQLYDAEEYDKMIQLHASKSQDYSAKALYHLGMAYYMKADDEKCLKFMDQAIQIDPSLADAFFIKGSTLNYMGQFQEAIKSLDEATSLDDSIADYYSSLGDAYFNLKEWSKALTAYQSAISREGSKSRAYAMIPQVYSALGKDKKALEANYVAKENISPTTASYSNVLYNIGVLEYLNNELEKAGTVFSEMLDLDPADYEIHAKMIQVYYGQENYKAAEKHRKILYSAYAKGALKNSSVENQFCFDQFLWDGKRIQAFESFQEKEGELYYKHIFYLVDEEHKIVFSIQTENSPISAELGGTKYIMGKDEGKTHYTYPVGLAENFDYPDLKDLVLQILNGDIKPAASSTH